MSRGFTELPLTAFGDLRVAELSPIFQGSFEYTVSNTELTETISTGIGFASQADAMAVLTTTGLPNSSALLKSTRHARYRSGLGGLCRFTTLFTSAAASTEQYVGLMDETGSSAAFENGYAVGYDGTTFGFHRFQNDVKFSIAQSAWDDPLDGTGASGMTIDLTKLNIFFIQYQYLGAGAIKLYTENDANGNIVLVHTMDYTNANTTPSVHNPNFHWTMFADNKGTSNNLIIKSASYAYFVEGKNELIEIHQPQFATGEQSVGSVTTEVAILTIRNKSSYASKTNFIDAILENLGVSIEAGANNNLGNFRLVKNATLGGTPSYSDIDATDSIVEIDTSGTTVTGGRELLNIPLAGKNDKELVPVLPYKIILAPSESITVAASSAASATVNASLLWKELF